MPSLREAQLALQAAILAPSDPAWAGDPVRLGVYRNAYWARLAGVLRVNYPVLAKMLDEEEFDSLACEYARQYPSRSFSIRWHGAHLDRVIGDPGLAELARMEWALGTAFDAADARTVDMAYLAQHPVETWSDLPLNVHPSVQVLDMAWNVEAQWEAVKRGEAPGPFQPKAHALLVWRKELQAHWRIATVEEGIALRALARDGTLQSACEAVPEDQAGQAGTWFALWVQEGMLAAR